MKSSLPAHQVRREFMRVGAVVSALVFALLGCGDLLDQWLAGYASTRFMLSTLFINAGISLGIFGIIGGIGCVVSLRIFAAASYFSYPVPLKAE